MFLHLTVKCSVVWQCSVRHWAPSSMEQLQH